MTIGKDGLMIDGATGEIVGEDESWERHRRIQELRHLAERSFLDLGRELYEFHVGRHWHLLGYPSWESYLGDPDVDIGRSMAFRLIAIHGTYERMLGLPKPLLLPAGHSKLDLLRPYVNPDNAQEWVGRAGVLSRSDLRRAINEELAPCSNEPELEPEEDELEILDEPWETLLQMLTGAWEALGEHDLAEAARLVDVALAYVRKMSAV